MKILCVSSEVVPFAKTGGLADVCGALPQALAARGHDVRVVMPRYRRIDREQLSPLPGPLGVPTGAGERWCQVMEGRLPGSEVPIYFLEHDDFFDRDELYGPPGEAFSDNCLRFALFSRGALQLCHKIGFTPDIIHCHDWQAALVAVYLRTVEEHTPLGVVPSVMTIHNLAYQGRFSSEDMLLTGAPRELFNWRELEFHGGLNLLKGGIAFGTLVSTVSPTYAEEIQTPEFGELLDGALRQRSEDLRGILNGIDDQLWNPATDLILPASFDHTDLSGKKICKRALQDRMGLPPDENALLLGFIGRLADQKGVDLLIKAGSRLVDLGCQIVVLGEGKRSYQGALEAMGRELPGIRAYIGFDEALAHLIQAGSDCLLMPSRYEPCGLNQLYAMRYGTIPIVPDVGGLKDSVVDASQPGANGIKMAKLSSKGLLEGVTRALALREGGSGWQEMMRQAMTGRLGWDRAAAEYEAMFEEACARMRHHRTLL